MRTLVLMHNRKPVMTSVTPGPIKARINEWPDDDVDLYEVWSAPVDYSHLPAFDNTTEFAKTWAMECEFGSGIEPDQYLAPVPAFVVHHARAELIRIWQRRMAQRDPEFLPDPTRVAA
jgi:hypothetical protein